MGKIKQTSTNYENKSRLLKNCITMYAISLIEGRWVLSICCFLSEGKMRFSELRRAIPEITERMLTLQLRKMEANKLVKRTVYAEVPPKVEYELTDIGHELTPILEQLDQWGQRHKEWYDGTEDANELIAGR